MGIICANKSLRRSNNARYSFFEDYAYAECADNVLSYNLEYALLTVSFTAYSHQLGKLFLLTCRLLQLSSSLVL